jgi:signal transduction histidine kinase
VTIERCEPGRGRTWSPTWVPRPGLRAALAALGTVVVIAAVLAIRDTSLWRTSYAGAAPEAAVTDLAAGLGLILSGLYVGAERGLRRMGLVLTLLGIAWLAADLVGWQEASPYLRALATAGALLTLPLLFDLVAMAPPPPSASGAIRRLVGGTYALAATVAALLVLARDPLADPACWDFCRGNPFLQAGLSGLEPGLTATSNALLLVGGTVIAVTGVARLVTSGTPARHELAPVLLPGVVAGALASVRALALVWRDTSGPEDGPSMALYQLGAWALAGLAVGAVIVARRRRRVRASLRSLAARGPDGHTARRATQALATATGDGSLRVAYPLSDAGGYVDAMGAPLGPVGGEGRVLTTIIRGDQTVAVIEHDPDRIGSIELAEHIGPAVRLSLENERLDAELLARVRELRASRERIVATADRERVRREQALHDGAQQRLLALTYDLRAARQAADGASRMLTMHLDEAIAGAHAAHDGLRELAHGIYPAVLGEAGLQPALEGLVERAAIPVRLRASGVGRCDQGAEMTAYVIADELVRDAAARGATSAGLRISLEDGALVLETEDDGSAPESAIVHGMDRAGAVGGQLTVSDRSGKSRHRLEVPCASS